MIILNLLIFIEFSISYLIFWFIYYRVLCSFLQFFPYLSIFLISVTSGDYLPLTHSWWWKYSYETISICFVCSTSFIYFILHNCLYTLYTFIGKISTFIKPCYASSIVCLIQPLSEPPSNYNHINSQQASLYYLYDHYYYAI